MNIKLRNIHPFGSIIIVLAVSLLLHACIDERYDLKRGISTLMTIGGDSLTVPLGKTDTIRLGDFLDPADMEMLHTMDDGGYALRVNDSVSAEIPSIDRSSLAIDEQTFRQQQTVDFGDISLDNFSIPGIEVSSAVNFTVEQIALDNFGLPAVDESMDFGAGMSGYTLTDLVIDNINENGTTGTVFDILTLPEYSGSESIPLPIEDNRDVSISYNHDIEFSISVPSGVTGVSNVNLKDNPHEATFKVDIQLVGANGVLTTGKIIPNLSINPSDLFNFTDLPSNTINFQAIDSMTANNQFLISKTYHFDGLNLSETTVNNLITKSSSVVTSGSVRMEDVYVLSNQINKVRDLVIRITVSVNDMIIESMDLDVLPVYSNISGSTDLSFSNDIPEDIRKVSAVYLDASSRTLSFNLQTDNMPAGINSEFNLDTLIIHFPPEFRLKPTQGLSGRTFTVLNTPFTNGFSKTFELESFDLSALEESSTLSLESSIDYSGRVSISFPNKVNSSKIPSSSDNDPKVEMNVLTNLAFESADVVTKDKNIDLTNIEVPISMTIDIAEQVKRLDTIKLAENSKIRLHISKPDIPLQLVGSPLSIVFPPLFTFKEFIPNNTKTITGEIPDMIELTLKSLNIDSELENGSLPLNTVIRVGGSVQLKSGAVNTKDVESLTNGFMDLQATSDDLKISSSTLKLNGLSTTFIDSTVLELATIELPDEIVSLDSILLSNGAQLELNIDISNMPNLDKPVIATIELDLPPLLGFAPGVAENNRVVIQQPFVKKQDTYGLNKTINLKGLFFDGQDLNGRLSINEKVRFNISIEVDETSVNSDDLTSEPIEVSVDVKLSGINFEKVYGKLNPGIQPIEQNIALSGLPSFLQNDDVSLDITKPVITLETNSNLGVPIFIDLDLKPSRKGVLLTETMQQVRIRLPKSNTPQTAVTTHYWIAPDSAGKPESYVFVEADIQKLFKNIPDDIQILINAEADISEQHYINLLADYFMDVKYDVTVPFAFGEDLNIAFKDTITGLDAMIGESALSGNSLELTGIFQNSIPLELELELTPLDKHNIPIDVVPARQLINTGASDGSPTTTNLSIELNDPNGLLKDLRGFELSFKASSNSTVAGTPIRPDNFIIAELKARLNGGITIGK